MAKADNPPFGRKQQDLKVHEWSRPVSDLDFRAIGDKVIREKNRFARLGKRYEAPNPIIKFMTKKLKRGSGISSSDMVAALKGDAETPNGDAYLTMSPDGTAFEFIDDKGKVKNRLKITSVPATLSKLRKKICK